MATIADMQVGQRGQVQSIAGSDGVSIRLLEMGLTPGIVVEFVGTAPLGDPLELMVRGYRLSVRRSEAARVEVTVV